MIRPTTYYQVHLGAGAARGEQVICVWLGWAGSDENLAHVRILHSTLPRYKPGRVGLIARERLIPLAMPTGVMAAPSLAHGMGRET